MLRLAIRDLVIRLDEERQTLQFLVPKQQGETGDLRVFYEILEPETVDGQRDLETEIGIALLSFLSATYSSSGFHLDDYRQAAKNLTPEWEAERHHELDGISDMSSAVAKYERAMQKVAEGLRAKSRALMNEAEALFKEAAALGNIEAIEYLANLWPPLKERSDRTFK
jgi:hypothetical protein